MGNQKVNKKTIGERVLGLYADREGLSDTDMAALQKEFSLTPKQAATIRRVISDGVVVEEEFQTLKYEFGSAKARLQFQAITGSNQSEALMARAEWYCLDIYGKIRSNETLKNVTISNLISLELGEFGELLRNYVQLGTKPGKGSKEDAFLDRTKKTLEVLKKEPI